ncbi:MAG: tetratricopeptide repeat protein, partial [Vulcanimicrobiaceae bacterium]
PVAQYAISLTVDDRPTSLATETVVGCSLEVGNDDQARAALDAGLARAPNDARLHLVSGGLYDEAGAVDMAREQYRAAIRLDPSSALAYAALGTLELQQGWFARAKQLIERAQQLGPSLDSVQLALAYANVLNAAAYGGQGKAYPAAVRMARAVATDPRTDPLTAERAWLVPFLIAVLRHDDAGAAGVVRDAAAGGRGSAAFDVDAARLAAANGDRPLARAMVRRAAALAPNSPLVAAARKEIGS